MRLTKNDFRDRFLQGDYNGENGALFFDLDLDEVIDNEVQVRLEPLQDFIDTLEPYLRSLASGLDDTLGETERALLTIKKLKEGTV